MSADDSLVAGANLPVDADFIAGSSRDAYGGLREAQVQHEGMRS